MTDVFTAVFQVFGLLLLIMAIIGVVAAIALIGMVRQVREIRIPHGADFFETMHYVPFMLVLLLDLLDFGLDIFSAPICWIILDRMGMSSLRNMSTLQSIVPLTGPVPVMTVSWLLARLFNLGSLRNQPYPAASARGALDDPYYAEYDGPRQRRTARVIDMEEDER
jgi:hypothetical protein